MGALACPPLLSSPSPHLPFAHLCLMELVFQCSCVKVICGSQAFKAHDLSHCLPLLEHDDARQHLDVELDCEKGRIL